MQRIPDLPTIPNRPMYVFLLVLTLANAIGYQGWSTLYTNFAVHEAGLTGAQNGLVQSLREVPGLLSIGVILLLLVLREHRLAALSVVMLGGGVLAAGFFPSFGGIVFTTMLMSFGFHYFETTNQSLILQYFDVRTAPLVIGRLRGLNAGGNLAIGAVIFVAAGVLPFSGLFAISGGLAVLAGLWALTQDPRAQGLPVQRRGMVMRKRYWLFYLLTLLGGARRQIFIVFSAFLLVERFEFGVREMTLFFMLNNAVNWFLNPLIGRAINAVGERRLLVLECLSLGGICLAYTVVEDRWLVGLLYVLDQIFFNFIVAVRTYFQKIADPADIAPSMAVGVAVNHVAAVVVPAVGGMLWMMDFRIPFYLGAALAGCSLVTTLFMRLPARGASC